MSQSIENPLEQVWTHREEVIYPDLFGAKSNGIFVIKAEMFQNTFQQSAIDPRWLSYGVIEFEPTSQRNTWLYVTSGASNPWELEAEEYASSTFSGFGTELVIESPLQAVWPIVILQRLLAFNILLVNGRYGENASPLDYEDRVPLRGSISLEQPSALEHVVIGRPTHFSTSFQLASGQVDLLQIVGITEVERDFAKTHSSEALIKILIERGCYPVTDPTRFTVIQ
jgi:Suppressor of fused protein (SUFU)